MSRQIGHRRRSAITSLEFLHELLPAEQCAVAGDAEFPRGLRNGQAENRAAGLDPSLIDRVTITCSYKVRI